MTQEFQIANFGLMLWQIKGLRLKAFGFHIYHTKVFIVSLWVIIGVVQSGEKY